MLGHLSFFSQQSRSGADVLVAPFDLYPASESVGEFLVCLTITPPTNASPTVMVDVTKRGTGITDPIDVFRTRHVQRCIWPDVYNWYYATSYNLSTNETTFTWTTTIPTLVMPFGRWGNPFTQPKDYATASYVESGFASGFAQRLDHSLSTNPADRVIRSIGEKIIPDPIYFSVSLLAGQYLRFETKMFEDDPFRIDSTTPTLVDSIPITTSPSASEVSVSSAFGAITAAWMLRI
jgi:hypothetical protein